ncbi:MAG: RidA family protein [Bacteroidetes bacterium]|nr:RidA family protein [Bacteroidota bacterium]MBM3424292.1 RidA family protein [Bacteroidota bacterium]
MKKAIHSSKAPAPIGPYSPAVAIGNQLYISGQIPIEPSSGRLISESIELSTLQVMKNIEDLLHAAGYGLEDVVKCTVFLRDFNNFQGMNNIYGSFFVATPPARETVEVSRLPMDAMIEISCIAIKS